MLNARHRFALLWQRLVAALSLVMAASLAPGATTAPAGAGAVGSRAGGTTVTSAAGALAGQIAAVIEGGQHQPLPLDTSAPDNPKAKTKAFTVAAWQELVPLPRQAVHPPRALRFPPPTYAPRSGHARAPPAA